MRLYAFLLVRMHFNAEKRGQDKGSGPTFLGSPLPVLPSLGFGVALFALAGSTVE